MRDTQRSSQSPPRQEPQEHSESVWSLAAFWLVAFAGTGLFAAVMLAPRWEQRQHMVARVRTMAGHVASFNDANERLVRVIEAFKHDPDFTAEMVRSELGYVAPGERRIAAPVRGDKHPATPGPDATARDPWAPFVRLFAHDTLVRHTALVTAAVFLVVALAFFQPQRERSSRDRAAT